MGVGMSKERNGAIVYLCDTCITHIKIFSKPFFLDILVFIRKLFVDLIVNGITWIPK